jgi:LacI family transcriptional regulator
MRSSVTIADVARKAGVSIKTVSRVANNEPHVRPALRDRVGKVMRGLGYSPNIAARRLASNSAFAIGLLFGGAPGEYFPQIILSILNHEVLQGYTVLVADFAPFDEQSRSAVLDLVNRKHIDGLILTPPCDNDAELLRRLEKIGVPLVRLTPADSSSRLPSVSAEDGTGAYEMTRYVLGLGHRRIAFVGGDPNHHASRERFDGFRRALRDSRVPFDRSLVRRADFLFEGGVKAGRELFALPTLPTAVFACNDESAAGVLVAAQERGLRIPADVSVVGFDDFPTARKTYPALTTVRQDLAEISSRATRLLFDLINGSPPATVHIRVPTELVIRHSAGTCTPG